MTAEERQHHIEEYIQRVEFASLEELSKHVGVSISTVRRDLNFLEGAGSIRRTHGGARLINPKSDEFTFASRDTHEIDEKELIGKASATLVRPGQTVIIDAGTTVFHVAKQLTDRNMQIVTHSLPVANLFLSAQMSEVVVTGGVIYPRLGVLVGPLSVKAYSEIHADIAFMGAGGITPDGLTNSHGLLIDIQRAIMKSASRIVFCLDHTKFGRKSVAFLCNLDAAPTIVTDGATSEELVESIRQKGVTVLVASPEGVLPGDTTASSPGLPAQTESTGTTTDQPAEEAPAETEAAVSMVGWD